MQPEPEPEPEPEPRRMVGRTQSRSQTRRQREASEAAMPADVVAQRRLSGFTTVAVTFDQGGTLGLNFLKNDDRDPLVIEVLRSGTQAVGHPELMPGQTLVGLTDQWDSFIDLKERKQKAVSKLIQHAGRPLVIHLRQPDPDPDPDLNLDPEPEPEPGPDAPLLPVAEGEAGEQGVGGRGRAPLQRHASLKAGMEALASVDKNSLTEIKAMGSPPEGVKNVMCAVALIFGEKLSKDPWGDCQMFMKDGARLLADMADVDSITVSPSAMKKVKKYIDREDFTPDRCESKAAAAMCAWVIGMYEQGRLELEQPPSLPYRAPPLPPWAPPDGQSPSPRRGVPAVAGEGDILAAAEEAVGAEPASPIPGGEQESLLPEPVAAAAGAAAPGEFEKDLAAVEASTAEDAAEGQRPAEPALEPAAVAGLWRASGTNVNGEIEEEFLQLNISSSFVVTGMIDSDGDGVWSEKDCRIANGFFDSRTCQLKFDQVYDINPSAEDVRTGFDTTTWVARYDASSKMLVDGTWSTAAGVVGSFSLDRTTEETMRNRTQGAEPGPEQSSRLIHVRGIGGKFETQDAVKGIFRKFGPVRNVTIGHRTDKDTGANTAWALVTMESREAAEVVMAAASAGRLPPPVTVTRFDKLRAAASTGQMGSVHREVRLSEQQKHKQQSLRAKLELNNELTVQWCELEKARKPFRVKLVSSGVQVADGASDDAETTIEVDDAETKIEVDVRRKQREKRISARIREAVVAFLIGTMHPDPEDPHNQDKDVLKPADWRLHVACCVYVLLVMSTAAGVMLKPGGDSVWAAWIACFLVGLTGTAVGVFSWSKAKANAGKVAVVDVKEAEDGEEHHHKRHRDRTVASLKLVSGKTFELADGVGVHVRQHKVVLFSIWLYTACLFGVPATIMAEADGTFLIYEGAENQALGGYLFLFVLWCFGWIFLWLDTRGSSEALASVRTEMVDSEGRSIKVKDSNYPKAESREVMDILGLMTRMPSGLTMQLKLVTQVYEGFTYCSFSFFPAFPWKSVKMPPYVPRVETVFLYGILEYDVTGPAFFTAVAFVPLSFLLLHLCWHHTGKKMLLIEFAYAAVTFPIMKQFVDVFSCTGASRTTYTQGEMVAACHADIPREGSCMDVHPDVECWTPEHFVYIIPVMYVFVPYYIVSLVLRTATQAKSSAVIVDGISAIVAFQLKLVLAVVASGFGECYPTTLIATMWILVVIMLLLSQDCLTKRRFSNVVQLNVIRQFGLVLAMFNGAYAVYINQVHGTGVCTDEVSLAGTGTENFIDGQLTRVVADWYEFLILILVQVIPVVFGVYTYRRRKALLDGVIQTVSSHKISVYVRNVDYSLIQFRLKAEAKPTFDLWVSEERDGDVAGEGAAKGKQIEDVTLDMVLFAKDDNLRINKVPIKEMAIKGVDVRAEGGFRLLQHMRDIDLHDKGGSTSWASLQHAQEILDVLQKIVIGWLHRVTCHRCSKLGVSRKLAYPTTLHFVESPEAIKEISLVGNAGLTRANSQLGQSEPGLQKQISESGFSVDVKLLTILTQIPMLTGLNISGTQYDLVQFIHDDVLKIHDPPKLPNRKERLYRLTIALPPLDARPCVDGLEDMTQISIGRFTYAREVLKWMDENTKDGRWQLQESDSGSDESRRMNDGQLHPHNIRPDHLKLMLGFMWQPSTQLDLTRRSHELKLLDMSDHVFLLCGKHRAHKPPKAKLLAMAALAHGGLHAAHAAHHWAHAVKEEDVRLEVEQERDTEDQDIIRSWQMFCATLAEAPRLTELTLCNIGLHEHTARILFKALEQRSELQTSSLRTLDVSRNDLGDAKEQLADMLRSGLKNLDKLRVDGSSLLVSILQCEDLKNTDHKVKAMGLQDKSERDLELKNDPYVVVKVGTERHRTATLFNAGSKGNWGPKGQTMPFYLEDTTPTVEIKVFDQNHTADTEESHSSDDLIGMINLDTNKESRDRHWVELHDKNKKGSVTGRLEISWKTNVDKVLEFSRDQDELDFEDMDDCDMHLLSGWLCHLGDHSDPEHDGHIKKVTLRGNMKNSDGDGAPDDWKIETWGDFCDALGRTDTLTDLDLSEIELESGHGTAVLTPLLESIASKSLRTLVLNQVDMGPQEAKTFANMFGTSKLIETVTSLDLSGNRLGEMEEKVELRSPKLAEPSDGKTYIADIFNFGTGNNRSKIETLKIDLGADSQTVVLNNQGTDADGDGQIVLAGKQLDQSDVNLLAKWIAHMRNYDCKLTSLDLGSNMGLCGKMSHHMANTTASQYHNDSWRKLAEVLCNAPLTKLLLPNVGMGPYALESLFRVSEQKNEYRLQNITVLDISHNPLRVGKAKFAEAIPDSHLERLTINVGHDQDNPNRVEGEGLGVPQVLELEKELNFSPAVREELTSTDLGPADLNLLGHWCLLAWGPTGSVHQKKPVLDTIILDGNEHLFNQAVETEALEEADRMRALKRTASKGPLFHANSSKNAPLGRYQSNDGLETDQDRVDVAKPMRDFCKSLTTRGNTPLRTLKMAGVQMGDAHAQVLAAHLEQLGVTELDVSNNKTLTQVGRESIFKAVAGSTVKVLTIDFAGEARVLRTASETDTGKMVGANKQGTEEEYPLNYSGQDLKMDDLALLREWIKHTANKLQRLSLGHNHNMIGETEPSVTTSSWESHHCQQWTDFCTALHGAQALKSLDLQDVQMGPLAAKVLADVLIRGSTEIAELDLSGNPLGQLGLEYVFDAVNESEVRTLTIDFGEKEVNKGHKFKRHDSKLDMAAKQLDAAEILLLSHWISHSKDFLEELYLDHNSGVNDKEVLPIFCAALKGSAEGKTPLKSLSIADIGMDLAAAIELAATTSTMPSLATLNLSRNSMISLTHWDDLSTRWAQFCDHLRLSKALRTLSLSGCMSGSGAAQELGKVLRNGSLRCIDISDNQIFTAKSSSEEKGALSSDPAGWEELCAALHDSKCVIEEFHAARIGLLPLRLRHLYERVVDSSKHKSVATGQDTVTTEKVFPPRIKVMNLSGNGFAARIAFVAPPGVRTVNSDKGGKSGKNGWTKLCGVDNTLNAVPLGVILTNGPCGRVLKVLNREEGWKKNATPEAQRLVIVDTLTCEADEISVVDALKNYDAYDPREVFVGSYPSHAFWPVLEKCNLVHLDLVDCVVDARSVLELASAVKHMDHLETMRMSATGCGPWRGQFGVHVPEKREAAPVYDLKLDDSDSHVDLSDKDLGPEDACLVASWMTRPQVCGQWETISLKGNLVFGNLKVEEDQQEGGIELGEYRILSPNITLNEGPHAKTAFKEAVTNFKLRPGQVVNVREFIPFTQKYPQHGKGGKVQKEAAHLRYDVEASEQKVSYAKTYSLWLDTRDGEGTVVAKNVRDHTGWEALCVAMGTSFAEKPRQLKLDLKDAGRGIRAKELAQMHQAGAGDDSFLWSFDKHGDGVVEMGVGSK